MDKTYPDPWNERPGADTDRYPNGQQTRVGDRTVDVIADDDPWLVDWNIAVRLAGRRITQDEEI